MDSFLYPYKDNPKPYWNDDDNDEIEKFFEW